MLALPTVARALDQWSAFISHTPAYTGALSSTSEMGHTTAVVHQINGLLSLITCVHKCTFEHAWAESC